VNKLPTIYGFNESSDGGPDPFGVSVFLAGCNMRCPFCINSNLINYIDLKEVPFERVRNYIVDNDIEWVTISGGEPTIHDDLPYLIEEFVDLGVKVNLSTNGLRPNMVENVLDKLSYVTLDIKTHDAKLYAKWVRWSPETKDTAIGNVIRTKCLLNTAEHYRDDFTYEIRTTIVPAFIDRLAIEDLSSIIDMNEKWVLQKYRRTNHVSEEAGEEHENDEEIKQTCRELQSQGKNVFVRYV